MLYHLVQAYGDQFALLNVFRYVTFRSAGAALTALVIFICFGPRFIAWLKKHQRDGQPIRSDGPASHLVTKKGTPTMGGLLILFAVTFASLLWARLDNPFIWIVIGVTLCFGFLGALDDFAKLTKRSADGISARMKFLLQLIVALIAVLLLNYVEPEKTQNILTIPFFKDFALNLGMFYVPFAFIVMVGASNAVNLTDGLDGLAIMPVVMCAGCFALISYLVGNTVFSNYLQLRYVPGTQELAVFCSAIVGAGLGFLWYNAPPASVFMGDTGSLALGGALGTISLMTKHEIVLLIVGGVFVFETVSVILQVGSFKLRGKRIFLMAPIHHHFEKKGWSEPQVVMRFWIISAILALLGLMTLKLR